MREHSQLAVDHKSSALPKDHLSGCLGSKARSPEKSWCFSPWDGGQKLELALQWPGSLHVVLRRQPALRRHPAHLGHGERPTMR